MPTAARELPVEEEYVKNPDITPRDIRALRDWLSAQPHLPAPHITDLVLVLAYHCSGRSSEVTKQLLDLNYTLRTLFTSFFEDRKVDARVVTALSTVCILPLKTRARDGSAVIYTHVYDTDVNKFNFADAVRSALMVLDVWQREEGTWPGFIICLDMSAVSLAHVARLDLHSLRNFFYYLQKAMLVNLKGVHFLNAPTFMDKVMLLIRPFLERHLLDMIRVHERGSTTIDTYVPADAFPADEATLLRSRDEVIEKLTACSEYFAWESGARVAESLRPGGARANIFGGVDGSFKKLDID